MGVSRSQQYYFPDAGLIAGFFLFILPAQDIKLPVGRASGIQCSFEKLNEADHFSFFRLAAFFMLAHRHLRRAFSSDRQTYRESAHT